MKQIQCCKISTVPSKCRQNFLFSLFQIRSQRFVFSKIFVFALWVVLCSLCAASPIFVLFYLYFTNEVLYNKKELVHSCKGMAAGGCAAVPALSGPFCTAVLY